MKESSGKFFRYQAEGFQRLRVGVTLRIVLVFLVRLDQVSADFLLRAEAFLQWLLDRQMKNHAHLLEYLVRCLQEFRTLRRCDLRTIRRRNGRCRDRQDESRNKNRQYHARRESTNSAPDSPQFNVLAQTKAHESIIGRRMPERKPSNSYNTDSEDAQPALRRVLRTGIAGDWSGENRLDSLAKLFDGKRLRENRTARIPQNVSGSVTARWMR